MNNMREKKIMGFTDRPIAGKVSDIIPPQYPGEVVSYRVTCIEDYEGSLEEGNFTDFDQDKWTSVLIEWNKIMRLNVEIQKMKFNIKSILTYKNYLNISANKR